MNKNIEKIGRKINDNIFFKYFDNRNFENWFYKYFDNHNVEDKLFLTAHIAYKFFNCFFFRFIYHFYNINKKQKSYRP
jgi:hypothetical protein